MADWLVMFLRGTLLSLLFAGVVCDTCSPLEFDVKTLNSVPYWWFKTDAKYCLNSATPISINGSIPIISHQTCIFMFSLCNTLPDLCPDQAVCQTSMSGSVNQTFKYFTWPVKVGTNKYDGFEFGIGENDFSIQYRNGDVRQCDTLATESLSVTTNIKFQCNNNAKWNNTINSALPFTGAKAPQPELIERNGCIYNIVFNSSEGCRYFGPGGSPGKALSIGSIILILFFPSVFLYFAIGGLINTSNGKRGKDVVPNYGFWSDLPYLILDGFGFVVSIITCNRVSGGRDGAYQSM